MMSETSRTFIFDSIPALRDAFSKGESSGDGPPIWFALIFGGVGSLVMVSGFFSMGFRNQIAIRHSRLHHIRRWFVFSLVNVYELSRLTRLETKASGDVNENPRYRLTAHFKNNKKAKLISFSDAQDVGQLYARLSEYLPEKN